MKPFNLADALAGKPVITRDGMKVIHLFIVPEENPEHRLFAVLKDGVIITLHEDGKYYDHKDYYLDLFMAPTIKIEWEE